MSPDYIMRGGINNLLRPTAIAHKIFGINKSSSHMR